MKASYLIPEFRETVHRRFPEREAELNAAFEKRIAGLRADTAGASKEKRQHLENQILPGIAIYETLQTVMPKEEALQTVHGYVEKRAWRLKGILLKLCAYRAFTKKCRAFSQSRRRSSSARRQALPQQRYRSRAGSGA